MKVKGWVLGFLKGSTHLDRDQHRLSDRLFAEEPELGKRWQHPLPFALQHHLSQNSPPTYSTAWAREGAAIIMIPIQERARTCPRRAPPCTHLFRCRRKLLRSNRIRRLVRSALQTAQVSLTGCAHEFEHNMTSSLRQ